MPSTLFSSARRLAYSVDVTFGSFGLEELVVLLELSAVLLGMPKRAAFKYVGDNPGTNISFSQSRKKSQRIVQMCKSLF